MTVAGEQTFECPACGAVVRLTEFTGGGGPTIVSRPSPLEVKRKRADAFVGDPDFDLGIETSMRGASA